MPSAPKGPSNALLVRSRFGRRTLSLEQRAQFAEEFAVGMRRLVLELFLARIARQLPQVLAVRLRVLGEQRGQRLVAVLDQFVAQRFDAMQRGRFAPAAGLFVFE